MSLPVPGDSPLAACEAPTRSSSGKLATLEMSWARLPKSDVEISAARPAVSTASSTTTWGDDGGAMGAALVRGGTSAGGAEG